LRGVKSLKKYANIRDEKEKKKFLNLIFSPCGAFEKKIPI